MHHNRAIVIVVSPLSQIGFKCYDSHRIITPRFILFAYLIHTCTCVSIGQIEYISNISNGDKNVYETKKLINILNKK